MKVTLHLILLTILCQHLSSAKQNNRLIFDLTKPVNELIGKNIAEENFRSDVFSAFDLIGANVKKSTVFYEADGSSVEEFKSRTKKVCKIIHKTLDLKLDSQLIILWRDNGCTIDIQNFSRLHDKTFAGHTPKLLFHICNNVCGWSRYDEDKRHKIKELLNSNNGTFVGISYDEADTKCETINELKGLASIVVVNLRFGKTTGVTESFGLFQNRMKFLSQDVNIYDPNKQVIFYPHPKSVGDDKHQSLLIQFASIWTTSKKTVGAMLLQVPNSRFKASTTSQFSIIPEFNPAKFHATLGKEKLVPFLLTMASFQRNQMISVNAYLWNLWNSMPEDNYGSLKTRNIDFALSLPASFFFEDNRSKVELKHLQKRSVENGNGTHNNSCICTLCTCTCTPCTCTCTDCTCTSDSPPPPSVPSVPPPPPLSSSPPVPPPPPPPPPPPIPPPIKYPSSKPTAPVRLSVGKPGIVFVNIEKDKFPNLPNPFPATLAIGCSYDIEYATESYVEHVVDACQSINGSLYILAVQVTLKWYNDKEKYSFYFENNIRDKLHMVNWFRKEILKRVPSARVYFTLDLKERHTDSFWNSNIDESQSNSLFCDELGATGNLYFEGIFNWAKLEDFPVIKLTSNQLGTSFYSEWFTLLRRLNYPYPDWAVKEMGTGRVQSSSINNPAFLMQDYLKSIHNWEPDSCIVWTEERREITYNFFHTPKIGTVFQPSTILKNGTLTKDEYATILEFIFYRFRMLEIEVNSDFRNILDAIENKMASEDFNSEIFIKYQMEKQDQHEDFMLFLAQLKRSKISEKQWFKGVHAEPVADSGILDLKSVLNSSKFESVLKMMKIAKLSNVSCGIELPSVQMCTQLLETFALREANSELIGTVNYFVCKETFSILTWRYNKTELQFMLDSHLFLSRTMHQIVPHLRVYFRVEFDFEIDFEDNAGLDRYISLLALFKAFGTKYDISYLFVIAFDGQLLSDQNGWWEIINYSDLANPQSYLEKATVLRGQQMWYPFASQNSMVTNSQDPSLVIIVSSVSSGVVLLLIILGIFFGLRYRKLQHLSQFLSDSEVQEFLNGRVSANTEPAKMELMESVDPEHAQFNQEYKLDFSDITIDFEKILGSGAFGMVYRGLTKNAPAAIKRPNADCSKTTFKSVLTEVKVLAYIGNHPNVVGFFGAYVEEIHKGILYISTELCSRGSMEAFLRTKSKVVSQSTSNPTLNIQPKPSELYAHELDTFAMEIAQGMEYIESRRVVHGDLATRNVLLDDNLVCKIGDFGLSRKLYEYQKYVKTSQEPLPWKWMAPESLTKMEFTSQSDVWSFGVTIWEIYTLGKIPYGGLNWTVDFAKDLENGLRLPIPDFAPENIFAKMLECWKLSPDERPTFTEIVKYYKSLGETVYTVLDSTE